MGQWYIAHASVNSPISMLMDGALIGMNGIFKKTKIKRT